ncbi:MAG: hypothetical protein RI924_1196, partial [Bacteroidota bacterium]
MKYYPYFFIIILIFSCKKQASESSEGPKPVVVPDKKIVLKDQEFKVAESLNLLY